jgi:hypothetical protein
VAPDRRCSRSSLHPGLDPVYRYAPVACKRAETLVNLGIAYEVVLALAIGVINQWDPSVVLAGRLSWICVLVLLHPMIVPGPPRKILVGSLIAASMDPVGLAIARLRGLDLPPMTALVWAYPQLHLCRPRSDSVPHTRAAEQTGEPGTRDGELSAR